jgi:hypothetical protein
MDKMRVYLVMEWDNAKDEARYRKYAEFTRDNQWPAKKEEEGLFKRTGISDNTGHMMGIWEFEDTDAFSKLWNDREYHELMVTLNPLVDNLKVRIGRAGMPVPEG